MPTAAATIFCSAMYISKKRSGATFFTSSECVELLTSASSVTTSPRATLSAASASPCLPRRDRLGVGLERGRFRRRDLGRAPGHRLRGLEGARRLVAAELDE